GGSRRARRAPAGPLPAGDLRRHRAVRRAGAIPRRTSEPSKRPVLARGDGLTNDERRTALWARHRRRDHAYGLAPAALPPGERTQSRSAGVGRRGAGARARDRPGEALPGAERVHLRPRASQSGAGARAEAAARARHRSAVADRRSGAGGGAGAGRAPLARIRDARSRLMPGSFAALQKSLARGAGNRLNRARSGTARPMAGDDSRTAVSAT